MLHIKDTGHFAYGVRVFVNSHGYPKLKLSSDAPVSDKFRGEFNQWLLDMFGTQYVLDDGQIIHSPEFNGLIMNPNTFHIFTKQLAEQEK